MRSAVSFPSPAMAMTRIAGMIAMGASDEATQPWLQADIEKAFHDDLTGEGCR